MNVDDMFGALYSPGDGDVDPAGLITSLTRAASNKGAKVITINNSVNQSYNEISHDGLLYIYDLRMNC